jgi:hypothetical protein
MSCRWAKTYPLMSHGAQYVSEKVSDLSAFFSDTPRIRIQDVSNEHRYQIRIQVSDMLWVEVSVFRRL